MAGRYDIWSGFVDRTVDEEAGAVSWTAHIAADGLAVEVYQDHVAGFQEAEMLA